mgnify:CR=1 FL=1
MTKAAIPTEWEVVPGVAGDPTQDLQAVAQRCRDMRIDEPVQVGAQARHIAHLAEVGDVDCLRLQG